MKMALIIIAALILAYFAFSAVKPSKKTKQDDVFYYPVANVYQDLGEGEYYFYHSEQKEWIAATKISSKQAASLGPKISLGPVNPAWKNNDQDRMIHSVSLYGTTELIKKKFLEDSLKLVPKKEPLSATLITPVKDSIPAGTAKPKSGIKRFFDRLFGKKDPSGQ